MIEQRRFLWSHWQQDLPASIVVLLVALPLCLGVALASGAPLFSGLIAGSVGGIVIGLLSKSPLSVSGPAAGLTVIVLHAIQSLPTFEAFLLAVCLAGAFQILLGFAKAGVLGDFIPSSVIKGMLAAIGIILILKQLPHAVGYDADYEGDQSFEEPDGSNTFSTLMHMLRHFTPGAVMISFISIAFLFWWEKLKRPGILGFVPGSLVVVLFGIGANLFLQNFHSDWALSGAHLVTVPVAESATAFFNQFSLPDFGMIHEKSVWVVAITLAVVASLETLLSIEAIDKIDPFKRVTPTNRELMAQGVGNMVSGLIGGLPITSVIVRSSANANAGGRTKFSTIMHGSFLLLCVITIPTLLNLIPLSALAAILIATGYKLTKPEIFLQKYEKGLGHLIPFVVTIAAILLTDLLKGIAIGVVVGVVFVLMQNFRSAIMSIVDGSNHLIRFKKDLFFIHKYEVKQALSRVPNHADLLLDMTRVHFVDHDNIEIINDFITSATYRGIRVTLKKNPECKTSELIKVPNYGTA